MSLVGWWPLDGSAEKKVGEFPTYESGNVQYGSGKLGQCYDNTSDNGTGIELIRHDDFTEYEDVYSFSLWFKSTSTSSGYTVERILARDASEYPTLCIDQTQNGNQNLTLYRATNVGSVAVNEWHHFAMTVDQGSNTSRAFINGELVSTGGVDNTTTARPYVIGGNTEGDGDISGGHFIGKIDDVRLYDHILSEKEVAQLSRGKILHYKFNQDGDVTDASGQGNDGTLNGPTYTTDSAIGSGAYSFNGSGDFIGSSLSYNTTSLSEVTVSTWYNSSSSVDQIIAASDRNEYWRLGVGSDSENGVQWTVYSSDMVSSASRSEIQDGNWHHIVGVFDTSLSNDHKIYIDGELDSEESHYNSGVGSGNRSYTHIGVGSEAGSQSGSTGPDDWLNGALSDFRIYNRGLSATDVKEIYQQRASIDAGGTTHGHELTDGARESFESGTTDSQWNVSTGTISSNRSYSGDYSFGSWNDGGLEATWNVFDQERQIDSFEYVWKEDGSQTGHVVILLDGNGNEVQESGTENPQWYLNNGSGGRYSVAGYDGQGYNVWTRFRFDFDWENGQYDYEMYDLNGNVRRTGTTGLDNSTGVKSIRFTGAGYGSANYCRFDQIKINGQSISQNGEFVGPDINEVGPAPDSLVGWWPLDGNTNDYSENGNDGVKSLDYISPSSSSDLGWDGQGSGYNSTGGETDPCSGKVTFEEALQHAHDQGGRLPTKAEMENDATRGTGCGYDNELCWTADKGDDSSEHWVSCGDHSDSNCEGQSEVRGNEETAYVRMVADDDLNRSDPVILADTFIYDWHTENGYSFDGVSISSGLGQSAYNFNGSSDYINCGDPPALDVSNFGDSITLSVWLNPSDSGGGRQDAFGKGDPNTNDNYRIWINSGDVYLYIDEGGSSNRVNTNIDNIWTHVVGTWDGSTIRLYIDGVEQTSASLSGSSLASSGADFVIGSRAGEEEFYAGDVQDGRIYDRALSDAEVAQLYAMTDPREDQQLLQTQDGSVLAKEQFSELL